MPRGTSLGGTLLCALALPLGAPSTAAGQPPTNSESAHAPSEPAHAPSEPAHAPAVSPPEALSPLLAPYPEAGEGAAQVLLELLIGVDGSVKQSTVLAGPEPFASAASNEAPKWLFSPATRDGKPAAARIRVQIDFSPPEPPPEEDVPPEPAQGASAAPEAPPKPVINVLVEGVRSADVKQLGKAEVRQLPGAFGDPYRAIESLPGVTPIASGLPYFFVRGAPPGNVGYFFDRISVPLLFHVAAGPGVIHPAFIRSVDLYAGGYPARFGRFAGGIVSGEPEPPEYRTRGEANIRLVDAGAFVEVPFANGSGDLMVAGRYSYTGAVVSLLAPDVSVGYWDYQAKAHYQLTGADTVSVFGFGSHDFLAADNTAGQRQNILDLTFHRLALTHEHHFGDGSRLEVTGLFGLERTGLGGDPDAPAEEEDPGNLRTRSFGVRALYDTQLSRAVRLQAGADVNTSRVSIDLNFPADDGDEEAPFGQVPETQLFPAPLFPELVLDPLEEARDERDRTTAQGRFVSRQEAVGGAWLEAKIAAGSRLSLTPGLRVDAYKTGGTQSFAFEPRLGMRLDLTSRVALINALGIAHQPPSFAIPLPGLSATSAEGLQRALHSSAGVEVQLPGKVLGQATLFQNSILDSTDAFGITNLEDANANISVANDRTLNHSYGFELYLKRSLAAKLGGFASYTLSQSRRSVANLSGPSSFDRRHVLNVGLAYSLGRGYRLGTRVVTYSGTPAEVAYIGAIADPPRAPWYYRLDWRLEKRWPLGTHGGFWALVAEVLNTTLKEESLRSSCYAYGCKDEPIGPVTIPSVGIEASL